MLSMLKSLVGPLLSWLLKRLFGNTPPPSPEAVQASRAATAETTLAVEQDANAEIAKANQARADAAAAVVLHPGSVYDDDGFKRPDGT